MDGGHDNIAYIEFGSGVSLNQEKMSDPIERPEIGGMIIVTL